MRFCACRRWFLARPGRLDALRLCLVFGFATAAFVARARRRRSPRPKRAARSLIEDEENRRRRDRGRPRLSWLGMIVHALLSWKARIGRMFRARRAALRAASAAGRADPAHEPRFDGGRSDDADEDDDEDEEETPAPRRRAARARAGAPLRQRLSSCPRSTCWRRARASERTTLSRDIIQANAAALESVLRRFRRARRDHQCAARPGGDALRARARARHQIIPRDRPRRRHRPLDERGVGARRRRVGPQRHRHRIAEPDARESLPARTARPATTTTRAPPSCRSASARPSAAKASSSIWRACRIC